MAARPVKKKRADDDGPSLADLPRAGREIVAILGDMNVTKYDPRVIPQLLEFYYSEFLGTEKSRLLPLSF